MSELTVTVLRLGLLVLLWAFVLSLAGVLRSDLYGTRVINRSGPSSAGNGRAKGNKVASPRRNPRTPTHLVVTSGTLTGTRLPLRDKGVLIGRNPECSLVLDDDFASGRHARIIRGEDGWFVEDLGSTNGTFIGQFRVGEAIPVEAGTTVRIGKTLLELRS